MKQPEPVNADTEAHSYPFPYYRRTRLLKRIADTFVNEGEEAGNWMAQVYGARYVAALLRAEVSHEETTIELGKFISAWQAVTIPRLIDQAQNGRPAA